MNSETKLEVEPVTKDELQAWYDDAMGPIDPGTRDTSSRIVRLIDDHDALAAQVAGLRETLERLMVVGSAATGFLMCDFGDMHQYIEEIMGRPVYTHEMGTGSVMNEIQKKAKPDFVAVIGKATAALAQHSEAEAG